MTRTRSVRDGERIFGASEGGRGTPVWFRAQRSERDGEMDDGSSRHVTVKTADGAAAHATWRVLSTGRDGTAAGWHLWPAGTTRLRDWARELVVAEDWANGTTLSGSLPPCPWVGRCIWTDRSRTTAMSLTNCIFFLGPQHDSVELKSQSHRGRNGER